MKRDSDIQREPGEYDLLGYHLGLIDAQERAEIEAVAASEELRSMCASLDRLLAPLALDEAVAPADLEDRIAASVSKALELRGRSIPFPQNGDAASPASAPSDERIRSGARTTLRELAGLAAVILIFIGIAVPGYRHAQKQAQNQAGNLRPTVAGLSNYAPVHVQVPAVQPDGRSWIWFDWRLVRDGRAPQTVFEIPLHEDASERDATGRIRFPWTQRQIHPVGGVLFPLNSPAPPLPQYDLLGPGVRTRFLAAPELRGGRSDVFRIGGAPDAFDIIRDQPGRSDTFLIP